MAVRLVLAAMLTACAMLAGRSIAGARIKHADDIRRMMDDLQLLRVLTIDRLLPMGNALAELKFPAFQMTGREMLKDGRKNLSAAWKEIESRERREKGAMAGFTEEETGEISILFDAVGVIGRKDHEKAYADTIKRLGKMEEEVRSSGREKAKLYASLGALGGLAVSVLLV
ncbi:MAG: hypothetical protein IJC48_03945 [Clostridia bacterium]|nr:hypothetical protein [Clostridia bacterium]